jgi:SAM-dependent methyltransferase
MAHHPLRLYTDLAWLWPLWGDHETEYAQYCEYLLRLFDQHARRPLESLLVISCGGGKNVYSLKKRYRVTGLDLSPVMLELAAGLNPECEFVEGDMRHFALGRRFDAILLDDGVSHMTSRADLKAAFRSAYRHLEPGGVMIVTPDATTETFRQNRTVTARAEGRHKPDKVDVVFVENVYDPDPGDEHYEATMVYLIREDGALRIETDRCELGLFPLDAWREALAESGFELREAAYQDGESDCLSFVCLRPA